VLTGRNLHSHGGFPSPVTHQQEVTCYGNNGIGDANDNWRIEIEGGGTWDSGTRLRLRHVPTNHALHSHLGFSHPDWTAGQQEVTCFAPPGDANDWWFFEGEVVGSPIRAKHSGKVLDVVGISTANGAKIQQWDYLDGNNQKWTLESVGGGYYKIVA
jgi:dolichyl-phosphate-mannose--protein O-mannosyl transferase